MDLNIRRATADDASQWLQLLQQVLGSEYVAGQVYDPAWVAAELAGSQGVETWLAEVGGSVRGSISILPPSEPTNNPVANLARHLTFPANYEDGSAEALLSAIGDICAQRNQMAVMRVPAGDATQQALLEKLGFVCVGFQPLKHYFGVREGVLFYVRIGAADQVVRLPLSQSLTQINALAAGVLHNLGLANPVMVRDGVTGYPLQTELHIKETTAAAYDISKLRVQALNPPVEISGQFNRGLGMFRVAAQTTLGALLGRRGEGIVAGLSYYLDEHDRCMRLVDSFSVDDLSAGAMLQEAVRCAQEQLNALYIEVDFLMTAPRMLKSAEQLGFVPVAYLPGTHYRNGDYVDVVKMVKLNAVYSLDRARLTPHAREVVEIVDHYFEDQKVGLAVINLLRGLPVFDGLGDGELGKIGRLFAQKLYRAKDHIFEKGDSGDEAYVVMRGQVEIRAEDGGRPLATIGMGGIFGEQAFLEGAPRAALAIAMQPSILLVVQRAAFSALVQNEPHLGMVVMRNIARDLSHKLRHTNAAMAGDRLPRADRGGVSHVPAISN
jgi:CRP/FNR family cyclic AMP-dependent transcriptional regulator